MEKKKCKQCGKSFESKRSDSLYCSNTCKQQAHHKRATEKSHSPNEEKEMTEFYLDEYQGLDWENFDIITYCFLRRHLKGNVSQSEINHYINAVVWDDTDWRVKYDSIRRTKAFADFQEKFLSGEIQVFIKRSVNENEMNEAVN